MDPSHLHPRALGLLEHWHSIHPDRGLPGRQHFDPAANANVLPNITLVDVHRGPLRFRYRLLGGRVDTVFGRNLAGQWLDQLYGDRSEVLKQYAAVVETKQPVWRRGVPLLAPIANCATIEVLRLPLASDGDLVDKVVSVSLYFDAAGRELAVDPLKAG